MNPVATPSGTISAIGSDSRDPRVVALCSSLFRACRAVHFYPPGHPSIDESLSNLYATFAGLLDLRNIVCLDVEENSLSYEGVAVFEGEQFRENLAFLMYRDGIRALRFRTGVRPDELLALIHALAQAESLDRTEHDLATVLWDQDLDHIQVDVVDPLLEAEGESTTIEDLRDMLLERWDEAETMDLKDSSEPALEPADTMAEEQLVAGRMAPAEDLEDLELSFLLEPDILEQLLVVLCEVLAQADTEDDVSLVTRAITDVLYSYLERGEFMALDRAITQLREMREAAPTREGDIQGIIRSLASVDLLRRAVLGLDGLYADRRASVEAVLMHLRPWARPALLKLLMEAGGITARKTLLNVLTSGDPLPVSEIVVHLNDPRWYVVRNMVLLLGSLRDDSVIPALEQTLSHPDERVRLEAIRALANLDGTHAAHLVGAGLADPSSSVRVLAARSLARLGGADGSRALLQHVRTREFASRPESEVRALLEALGQVADDSAVPVLDELWASRSLFRGKPTHMRLAALSALGLIATPRARQSLLRASRSGDDAIRRQARKNLAEVEWREAST